MSQLVDLYLLAVLLYLFECLQIVPRGAVAVQSFVVGYRLVRAMPLGLLPRRGMLLGMPLPPLGSLLVATPWPVWPTEDGVIAEDGARLGWEALREARADELVVRAGKVKVARAATEPAARALAALVREMAAAGDAALRGAALDRALRARLAVAPARARLRLLRRNIWPLRVGANLLFLCVFIGAPLLLFTPLIEHWRVVATITAGAWMVAGTGFYAAADRLFAGGEEGPPSGKRFGVVLTPFSAMRGADVLGRYVAAPFDPWAVAAALLPRAAFEALARETLADLHYRDPDGDPDAADHAYLEAHLRPALAASLAALAIRPESLFTPPPPDGPESRSFCPRCRSQHVLDEGRCATCLGLPLLSLAAPAPPRVPFVEAPAAPEIAELPATEQVAEHSAQDDRAKTPARSARPKGKRRKGRAG